LRFIVRAWVRLSRWYVRFFVIEVHEIGQLCDPGNGPWWCVPRQATYQAFRIWQPFGVGALGVAA